jgi:hypothetical protein
MAEVEVNTTFRTEILSLPSVPNAKRPIEFEKHDVNSHIDRANGQCDRSDGDEVLPLPISWPSAPLHAIARMA